MNALFSRHDRAAAGEAPDRTYWAFLSYSHRDKSWADWLHGALESYRVPKSLVGRPASCGTIPEKLSPVFRDREELAASDDLGGKIRSALAGSQFLVVLCSPAAAASRWTNEEIATFKRIHPDGCVLAAIVEGEPFASEMPGREAEECFPPALRHRFGPDGELSGERAEPIAADFRESADGKRMGLLKLIAGMLGVGLDELVRREAQRRQRRLTFIAAGSLAGMVVASGLALAAFDARNDARRERAQAEELVGFMLGDLRSKLEPLGRLDVLDAVGARALDHYRDQDTASLSDEGLLQRAKALTLIGEIANLRGDLDGALNRYREAIAGTEEALRRAPNDEQRIFDHAQAVFWVGSIAWQRGKAGEAEASFREYRRLADRLLKLNPNKPEWRLERVYADTNLGMLLRDKRQFQDASVAFSAALADAERLAASAPRNRVYQEMVSEALAYLGDTRRSQGQLEEAMANRERQIETLTRIEALHGSDATVKRKTLVAYRALGHLLAERGEAEAGLSRLRQAASIADELRRIEPDNTEWLEVSAGAQADLAQLLIATGRVDQAEPLIRSSCDTTARLAARDASVVEWRLGRAGECLQLRAEAAAAKGRRAEALAIAEQAMTLARDRAAQGFAWVTATRIVAGDQLAALGQAAAARAQWSQALAALPGAPLTPMMESRRFLILTRLGRGQEAAAAGRRLDSIGYRHPGFVRIRG